MAKDYLDKDKHAQMRCVALMQKRYPMGVDNIESSQVDVRCQGNVSAEETVACAALWGWAAC